MVVPEPMGIIGIGCPEACPLLGIISVVMPAIAMGSRVVVIPSQRFPLAAVDFYQVLDTSDVPDGAPLCGLLVDSESGAGNSMRVAWRCTPAAAARLTSERTTC